MPKTKVLITVKTYPSLSVKYDELVCTAGFREDGTWIRIYPVAFRKKTYGEQYEKYTWIEIDLEKNKSDFRPESYRPHSYESEIETIGKIDRKHWEERKKLVLNKVYDDLSELILEAHDEHICTSLAVFKPTKIVNFKIEEVAREWDKEKLVKLDAERLKKDMFKNEESPFKIVKKLPYKFSYVLEDTKGKKSTMMIEDWEIGQLYWNCLKKAKGDEKIACEKVKEKYFEFFVNKRDLYLFLGTTKQNHYVSKNPFVIIGVFYPPIGNEAKQVTLF
ncbi:MAG: hypothetical protein EAZ97_15670 [Bacteroidetes bacterium]|nr:MAG: hypothetical protein EAZ97_15670 [Bacteroidota bacterium]